jgi:hypothetical protein
MGERFVNHISDKGLVSRIYKEHLQFTITRQITQLKNCAKDQWTFLQRKYGNDYKHVKIFLTSLAIMEVQIKTPLRWL